jgi:hypothetical protein
LSHGIFVDSTVGHAQREVIGVVVSLRASCEFSATVLNAYKQLDYDARPPRWLKEQQQHHLHQFEMCFITQATSSKLAQNAVVLSKDAPWMLLTLMIKK